MPNKIIRTICYFTDNPNNQILKRIEEIVRLLTKKDYIIQTKRICAPINFREIEDKIADVSILLSIGTLSYDKTITQLNDFYSSKNVFFNIDLSTEVISKKHTQVLFDIIKNRASKTFNSAYVFNNEQSTPYFPSANYTVSGFSIGLQPTDLSENCHSLENWFTNLSNIWSEIDELFRDDIDFLGIDSSVAPLYQGKSSLVNFIKRLGLTFSQSTTTETYLQISKFIKENNPRPIGLCGLMFPCLEDFELADEYENDQFSIERNIYLSLHCGLGIDTYPIGIDERPERVLEVLKLLQGLSNKYNKPLSMRFVSDGKAKIGEKTDFQNQYLKDVIIKKL